MDKFIKIKNGYSNYTERVSFSFEIIECSKSQDQSCKEEGEIKNLLDNIFFTFFYVNENVEFGDKTSIGSRPIIA